LKAGEPAPSLEALREDIVFEGWLEKKASNGIPGWRVWQRRYFVLYRASNELRFFKRMVRGLPPPPPPPPPPALRLLPHG
jgi:hypothetical protein